MQMVEQTNICEDHFEACRLVFEQAVQKRYKLQHIVCKHLNFKEMEEKHLHTL